mmetsp:Transcript_65136/g.187446  ORF Transcript_65136/g.187446 Transcript_65136/m.187446 type:complete len:350 (+) Transcript_65136:271-1320(+)
MKRHFADTDWSPPMVLYETSVDPPSSLPPSPSCSSNAGESTRRRRRRRAYRVPVNGMGMERIDNDHFVGKVVVLHRPPAPGLNCAHASYFETRTRRWEMRMQGRFRKQPVGRLYAGCVLHDFDYSEPLSWFSAWLGGLSLAPLERLLGAKLHFTFGDRGDDVAGAVGAELAHIVGELAVFDQIIVTPPGEAAPLITGELEGLGIRRSAAASSAEWSAETKEIAANIHLGSTYTFCFWSASRFIDLLGERLVNLIPLMPSIGLRTSILGYWPAHFVFYALDEGDGEAKAVGDPAAETTAVPRTRHLESSKEYLVDMMIVNESLLSNASLIRKYDFRDARAFNVTQLDPSP